MSIVLDALKKAESDLAHPGRDNGRVAEVKLRALQKQYHKKVFLIIFLNVLVLGAIGVLYKVFNGSPGEKTLLHSKVDGMGELNRAAMTEEGQTPSGNAQTNVATEPGFVEDITINKNTFIVGKTIRIQFDGVFEDSSGGAVLVGDDLFSVGQKIGEVLITDISVKKIILTYKGTAYDIPI